MKPQVPYKTRQAALTMLKKHGESSALQLAELLGVSVQAMRRHLRTLHQEGLVQSNLMNLGPGRPSNVWELTSCGHKRFQDASDKFAVGLLGSIEANLSQAVLEGILVNLSIKKASLYRSEIGHGQITQRLEKLVELLNQEGYMAELHVLDDGQGWYLNENHCSIKLIAENYPAVCDQELQFIRSTLPDCNVQRMKWRLESGHSCGFHISPINTNA